MKAKSIHSKARKSPREDGSIGDSNVSPNSISKKRRDTRRDAKKYDNGGNLSQNQEFIAA